MPVVPIEAVAPNPDQPRKTFADKAQKELTASIRAHGQLQDILVTPNGQGMLVIIAGERRYRACKALGHSEIAVKIIEEVEQPEVLALVENVQRADLSPVEEALAFRVLLDRYDLTQKVLARRLGKSPAYVSERLSLLDLPVKVRDLVLSGDLTFSHAKLLGQSPPEEAVRLATEAAEQNTSVRELRDKVSIESQGEEVVEISECGDITATTSETAELSPDSVPARVLPDEYPCSAGWELSDAKSLIERLREVFLASAEKHDGNSLREAVGHLDRVEAVISNLMEEES